MVCSGTSQGSSAMGGSGFLEMSTWFSRLTTPGLRGQGKDRDIFLSANGLVAVFDSDCKASVVWGELTGRCFGK